jgi:hypothetical protein
VAKIVLLYDSKESSADSYPCYDCGGLIDPARGAHECLGAVRVRASQPRVQLIFQTKPYRAWLLTVRAENESTSVRARTWFDDYTSKAHPPRPDITTPAALLLAATVRAALNFP